MVCPTCGNQVSPGEAFCGQCGTPMTPSAPSSQPTQSVNTPGPRNGLLSSYNRSPSPPPDAYNPQDPFGAATQNVPPNTFQTRQPSAPQQPGPGTLNPQTGFYQDATEAFSAIPQVGQQGYQQPSQAGPQGYQQPPQAYPGSGAYNNPPTQQQPYQSGNYSNAGYAPVQPYQSGQSYGSGQGYPRATPPTDPNKNRTPIIVAAICVLVLVLILGTFGTIYLTRSSAPDAITVPTATTAAATVAPTATPSPTPAPTATPSPTPAPTTPPTPAANPGFAWCTLCRTNGFTSQFPSDWVQGSTPDGTGLRFTSPASQEVFSAVKTPGPTSQTADQLVATDIQALNPKATDMSPTATTTIGGTTWTYSVAHYQPGAQPDRIQVYATVNQGKAYIIELQAPESQFDGINTQFFATTIGAYQFA